MAYIFGLAAAGWWGFRLVRRPDCSLTSAELETIINAMVIAVIVGGRLGYVLFYDPFYFARHPLEILFLWRGGMSFHGGLLGVVIALWWLGKKRRIPFLRSADLVAASIPLGLFLGRLANFANAELVGRATDLSWAVCFNGEMVARHPSQLYQAFSEGLLLFLLLNLMTAKGELARPGRISAAFLLAYGGMRFLVEFTRRPDAHIGFIMGLSLGQWLCLAMVFFGAAAWRRVR